MVHVLGSSLWDVENNAVRTAATLRAAGHKVTEIYFKDWISNNLDPANDVQLDNLGKIIRREELNVICLSIRASAYARQAEIITERLHEEFDIPVLFGAGCILPWLPMIASKRQIWCSKVKGSWLSLIFATV